MSDTPIANNDTTYDAAADSCVALAEAVGLVQRIPPTQPPAVQSMTNPVSTRRRSWSIAAIGSLLTTTAIIAVAVGLFQFSTTDAYATLQIEVNAAIQNARSVRFVETQGPVGKEGYSETYSIRGYLERIDQYQGYIVRDNKRGLCLQACSVCSPPEAVRYNIRKRTEVSELQPFPIIKEHDGPADGWAKTRLVEIELDGRQAILVEKRRLPFDELPQGAFGYDEIQRYWIDLQTHLPMRSQVTFYQDAEKTNHRQILLANYEWNIDLADDLFSLKPPVGHEFEDEVESTEGTKTVD